MELELVCGCGASLILDDLSTAQVEHIMNLWAALHPHSVEAQMAAAEKTYIDPLILAEDEDD